MKKGPRTILLTAKIAYWFKEWLFRRILSFLLHWDDMADYKSFLKWMMNVTWRKMYVRHFEWESEDKRKFFSSIVLKWGNRFIQTFLIIVYSKSNQCNCDSTDWRKILTNSTTNFALLRTSCTRKFHIPLANKPKNLPSHCKSQKVISEVKIIQ